MITTRVEKETMRNHPLGVRFSFADLYWIAAGVLLVVFIGSVANAWVLLLEILR